MPRQQVFAFGGAVEGARLGGRRLERATPPCRRDGPAARSPTRSRASRRASTPHPKVLTLLEAARRDGARGQRHRLGLRRDARVRLAAARGHHGAPHRAGHAARHVQPPPRRAARRARPARATCRSTTSAPSQARFLVLDSMLSEAAVLGFEYGFSSADPRNAGASGRRSSATSPTARRSIIDQFIAQPESKWQRMSGLVLLLPHGYEGQGPSTRARASSASCSCAPRTTCRSAT